MRGRVVSSAPEEQVLSVSQAPLVVLHIDDVMQSAATGNNVCVCVCVSPDRMDVEGSAGRDSTWRRAAADDAGGGAGGGGGGAGMEAQVVPLELYDSARAKIDANLRWLFAKAYGMGKAAHVFLLLLMRI